MKIDANPFGCTHHELEWCRRCTEFVLPERLVSILGGVERREDTPQPEDTKGQRGKI